MSLTESKEQTLCFSLCFIFLSALVWRDIMNKLSYDDVKSNLYKRGYILLEENYKNTRNKILVEDFNGYKYFVSYTNIIKTDPLKFSSYNPYTMDNISLYMKLNNIDLRILDGEWINKNSHFTWIDNDGYKYDDTFNEAIKGLRKVSRYNKFSIENIALYIKLNNRTDTLLSTEYRTNGTKNRNDKLTFRCKNNHIFKMTWADYFSGRGCIHCIKRYINEYEFLQYIKEKYGDEYAVLDKFVNSTSKIKVRHNVCGTIFETKPNLLANGHGCPRNECCKKRGEDHYKWNPNLTDEERLANMTRTSINEYNRWRFSVYKRDNYRCSICGCSNTPNHPLNAHHLNGWSVFIDQRYDIDNGVTLCEQHHKHFHSIYGYGNNTKEQFIEFIENHGNIEISNQIA